VTLARRKTCSNSEGEIGREKQGGSIQLILDQMDTWGGIKRKLTDGAGVRYVAKGDDADAPR
jgi:hypothetical protein